MMLKILLVICFTALLTINVTSATASTKLGLSFDHGFGIAGQFDKVNLFLGDDGVGFDYLFEQGSFSKELPMIWYIGGGAYYDWHDWDEVGVRIPFGISIPFTPQWDVFAQLSPAIELHVDDNYNGDDIDFILSGALGVRYAF